MIWYKKYKVSVPEGAAGEWYVRRFVVDEDAAMRTSFRAAAQGGRGSVPAGTYTGLYHGTELWMSDTPDEISDHLDFIFQAHGNVLVHGLGLGMGVAAVLAKPEVRSVLVVEIAKEVINLVAPHLQAKYGSKLSVLHGDALIWPIPKGAKWDVAWHDIWENISEDNLEAMTKLHRRFGRRVKWQGSWQKENLRSRRGW